MAFSVTARHAGNSGATSVQTQATNSATATADSLLLVASGAQNENNGTGQVIQTPVGGSLTYTQVDESAEVAWAGDGAYVMKGTMFRAPIGGSPGAHTVTVDHQAGTVTCFYAAVCCDVTGHDVDDPIVQSEANSASVGPPASNNAAGTVTLPGTPATGNLVVVAFFAGADNGGGLAAPTIGGQSMTELHNQDTEFVQGCLFYRVITGAESNAVITCSDVGQSVGQWSAIAVEIAIAEAGGEAQAVTPAVVGVDATPGTLTVDMSVAPGAVAVDATPGTVTVTAGAVGITPDAVTVEATPGTLSLATGITPGAVTVDATPGTLAVTTGAVDITPGAQTVEATPGTLTMAIGVIPGAVTVDATPGTLTVDLSVVLDPVTVEVTPGTLSITQDAQQVTPGVVAVDATPGTLVVTTGAVDVTPAAVAVEATPGTLTITQDAQQVTPGAVTIDATPGTLVVTPGAVDITPAAVTVEATPGELGVDLSVALTGPTIEATPGTVSITTGPVSIIPLPVTIEVTPGDLSIDDGSGSVLTGNIHPRLPVMSGGVVVESTSLAGSIS